MVTVPGDTSGGVCSRSSPDEHASINAVGARIAKRMSRSAPLRVGQRHLDRARAGNVEHRLDAFLRCGRRAGLIPRLGGADNARRRAQARAVLSGRHVTGGGARRRVPAGGRRVERTVPGLLHLCQRDGGADRAEQVTGVHDAAARAIDLAEPDRERQPAPGGRGDRDVLRFAEAAVHQIAVRPRRRQAQAEGDRTGRDALVARLLAQLARGARNRARDRRKRQDPEPPHGCASAATRVPRGDRESASPGRPPAPACTARTPRSPSDS